MAISRRIFRKQYKRPKLRVVFYNKIKPEIKRNYSVLRYLQARQKLRKSPLRKCLNISTWNSLTHENQLREQLYAHRDIHTFALHCAPKNTERSNKSTFQAYLPGNVWKKMSKQQRQEHLQKRNELIKSGATFSKLQRKKIGYRAYFINTQRRPIFKHISQITKMNYLKSLIARAKVQAVKIHQEAEPEISKISPNTIKTKLNKQQLINFRKLIKVRNHASGIKLINRLTPKKRIRKNHG